MRVDATAKQPEETRSPLEPGAEAALDREHGDVDMGTPTAAATNSLHDWRDAAARRRDGEDDENEGDSDDAGRWRISSIQDGAALHATSAMGVSRSSSRERLQPVNEQGRAEESSADDVVEVEEFRDYSDADIDSLDILPSQDFEGEDLGGRGARHMHGTRSSQCESCGWQDFRDDTQSRDDEASEVFDNVIYAPPMLPPRTASTSPPLRTTPPSVALQSSFVDADDMYGSESELSDGYDVPSGTFVERVHPTTTSSPSATPPQPTSSVPSSRPSSTSGTPPPATVQWCARMSVKRDCSFIDHTLKHRRKHLSVQDLSESGEEFEEKLKLIDGDDECESEDLASGSTSLNPRSRSTATSAAVDAGLLLPGFRPKKKRRRVRQLALDAFLKVQPSATY